jgi:adenine-specific DNA glycosylase
MNILLLQLHLSYNEAVPVVDGNVLVLSRYFDVETDIAQAKKGIAALAFEVMPKTTLPFSIRLLWSLRFAMCS